LIFAEGAAAETFVDNVDRMGFDNWAEHEALYADAPVLAELPYARAKASRQVPQDMHRMLYERAVSALTGTAPGRAAEAA
jgi:hypothetical protein